MSFAEKSREWLGTGDPPSSMFVDASTPIDEGAVLADSKRVQVRSDHDVLVGIAQFLEELVGETRRGNTTAREGAVSSCEIKFLANGTALPVIKAYAGSEVPVDEALDAYGRTVREATARALVGWVATAENLVNP